MSSGRQERAGVQRDTNTVARAAEMAGAAARVAGPARPAAPRTARGRARTSPGYPRRTWRGAIRRSNRFAEPGYAYAFARIVTHYWRHGSWLEEGQVLREAGRLAGIPGVLVQGSLDFGNLLGTPWE